MLMPSFTYQEIVEEMIEAEWHLREMLPGDARISFEHPHLPEALARVEGLTWLTPAEQRTLNQLKGCSYANFLGFTKEYIAGQALHHAQAELFGEPHALRALLKLSEAQVKHQLLFQHYCRRFAEGFKGDCRLLGGASMSASEILSKSPVAIMLATLGLALAVDAHQTRIASDTSLDPLLSSLLDHHRRETIPHARLLTLELAKMIRYSSAGMIERAFGEFFEILSHLDGRLIEQVEMDLSNLESAIGRGLTEAQREEAREVQRHAYRDTFISDALRHPQMISTVAEIWRDGPRLLEARVENLKPTP